MKRVREVIAYKNYFEDFLLKQPKKVQDKIFKVVEIIETYERVPSKYLKAIIGTNGLYEAINPTAFNSYNIFSRRDGFPSWEGIGVGYC